MGIRDDRWKRSTSCHLRGLLNGVVAIDIAVIVAVVVATVVVLNEVEESGKISLSFFVD
jgi:hypothetical protein